MTTAESSGQQSSLASQRAKEAKEPRPPFFALGYKEGFSQWWSKVPAATAEHRVLSFVPYLRQAPTQRQTGNAPPSPNESTDSLEVVDHSQTGEESTTTSTEDPYGPRRWRSRMVELSGKNRALNEFSIERVGEKTDNNLVILHGYGAGLGFFYRNFEALSRAKGWHLYALDLLGMGRSTRPAFRIKAKDRQEAVKEAEDWFIDSLEEWRIRQKIDRFTLMGHSLGGYMAVAYALKYPGRLNKLILASPVGIPEDPYAMSADLPEPGDSTLANEFVQDQTTDTKEFNNSFNARERLNAQAERKAMGSTNTPPRRPLPKWLTYLWDANVSPFSLVRWSGPLGPRLVSGWTSRRFSHLPENEAQALHDYAYSLFRMRGSGEYALAYILAPGAFARSPLIRRIHRVGRQPLPSEDRMESNSPSSSTETTSSAPSSSSSTAETAVSQHRENGIPIVLLYGDHDWMDVSGGRAAKEKIESERARILQNATPEQRAADNGSAKVYIIDKAGHHLYLENPDQFNKVILAEMEDVRRREAKRASS